MGVTNFPNGVNIGSSAGGTAIWQLGGTDVAVTAAELNAIHDAAGISDVEFNVLDGAVAGTAVANKAFVFGASKDIDIIDIQATSGLRIGGTAVTPTAAALNALVAGTAGGFKINAGSVVLTNGTAAVSTGLATVTSVQANPVGPLNSQAGTAGGFVSAAAWSIITGTIGIQGYDYSGTLTTSAGTVFWQAFGT